jgi:hypothetical protein
MGAFGAGLLGQESPVKQTRDTSKTTTEEGKRVLVNVEGGSEILVSVSHKVKKITFKD